MFIELIFRDELIHLMKFSLFCTTVQVLHVTLFCLLFSISIQNVRQYAPHVCAALLRQNVLAAVAVLVQLMYNHLAQHPEK